MEFVNIARVLWQRRLVIAVGALLALLIAVLAIGSSDSSPTGVAQTRVLLDHRKPIVADLAAIADTVGTQAALMSEVMAGDAQRDEIARRAGVAPAQLGMDRRQFAKLYALGQLPERSAKAAMNIARPYVVNVSSASPLPIITIDVSAPSAPDAARVAGAARDALQTLVATTGPTEQRTLVIKPLGGVRSATVPASVRSPLIGIAVAIFFFVFWCCGIVVFHGLRRVWRRATAEPAAVY